MTIRTPSPLTNAQTLLDLQRTKNSLATYTTQISSGNRIVNLADDPSGAAMILNFQASIDQNNQYVGQINTATGFLQNTETVADNVNTQVTRLMQLSQQAMSGTQSSTSLQAIASEVDSIYTNLVTMANTQVQGKYIFGGSATTSPPFDAATAPAGQPNSITYNGNNTTLSVPVGPAQNTATNIPGDTLFLGGAAPGSYGSSLDLFNVTKSLSQAITAGNTTAITSAYNNLQQISTHVNSVIASLGGWQNGISSLKTDLTAINSNLTAVQSSVQSVDYPTAITGYTTSSIAQQATLSIMAKMNAHNLFDYLA
jgi:flagellar hook-associated protein 3 FlgL